MDLSVMLARALGLAFTVFGLGALLNKDHVEKALDAFGKNHALQVIATVVPLLIGSFLVVNHNIWEQEWQVLVTIASWLLFVIGGLRALFPSMMFPEARKNANPNTLNIVFTLVTALGVAMVYYGFLQS